MPAPYNTADAAGVKAALDGDLLADAADLVQRWAPAPDPEPADYAAKAARAERRLYRYLKETGNSSASGVEGLTDTYKDMRESRAIVREVMGGYYRGSRAVPMV
jgi:predicted amidohydrolase YtcJ